MSEPAQFKGARTGNFFVGIGLLLIPAGALYIALFSNEDQFLHTRVRRGGGIIKMIEQTIGWELFIFLMLLFGAWAMVYSIVSLWKVINTTPDVTAHPDHLEFHPAVRSSAASYDEISHWSIEFVSGHPVLWIHFYEAYWSLQGLFKRKTIKLEGNKEQLTPLFEFFSRHPIMNQKFAR